MPVCLGSCGCVFSAFLWRRASFLPVTGQLADSSVRSVDIGVSVCVSLDCGAGSQLCKHKHSIA